MAGFFLPTRDFFSLINRHGRSSRQGRPACLLDISRLSLTYLISPPILYSLSVSQKAKWRTRSLPLRQRQTATRFCHFFYYLTVRHPYLHVSRCRRYLRDLDIDFVLIFCLRFSLSSAVVTSVSSSTCLVSLMLMKVFFSLFVLFSFFFLCFFCHSCWWRRSRRSNSRQCVRVCKSSYINKPDGLPTWRITITSNDYRKDCEEKATAEKEGLRAICRDE